jgi:Sulfotransferase domain
MIIWIASFPRSGNNLFRVALRNFFGIKSGSVFSERPGVDDLLDDVSLHLSPEALESAREQQMPVFVKTHRLAEARDPAPSLYLVRDGRDSIVSYAHFVKARKQRSFRSLTMEESLGVLIERKSHPFGSWSANVRSWTRRAGPTAIVRFEELVKDPAGTVRDAVRSLGVPLAEPSGELPSFEELHRGNPVVFRRGVVGSWSTELPAHLERLFWELHGAEMLAMGYPRGHPFA